MATDSKNEMYNPKPCNPIPDGQGIPSESQDAKDANLVDVPRDRREHFPGREEQKSPGKEERLPGADETLN